MNAPGVAGAGKQKTHSPSVTPVPRVAGPFFKPAGGSGFFGIQTKLSVSRPGDPMEREADRTAEKVMRAPAGPVVGAATGELQRLGEGSPAVAANAHTEIKQASSGGVPLPREVRSFMEPRFGADFSQVRVHANEQAHSLSNHLSARAFTHGQHIFFGRNQYQPGTTDGRQLLAHELTHTIQQGATVQRAAQPEAAAGVPVVGTASATPAVQRLGMRDALDYFADKANYIPGFRMLTLVLGFNPINGRGADRTAANLLRALIELVPGGAVITQVLDNHGVINKAATWIEQQIATLGDIGSQIRQAISSFLDSLGWSDILDLGGVWDRAKRIVTDPIRRLIAFGSSVVGSLLNLVKEAILRPLAALAAQTPAYDLLKAVLGYDPVSGDPYPRTAGTLIGGFMKLIGQEELWQNLKKGNAVGRAFAWFQGALSGLLGFVTSIPQKVVQTLTSLTFTDVITVVGAFRKVGSAFLDVVGQFMSWAGGQVLSLLEILVSVVAPGVMPYIAKAKAAFHTIIQDPVRFVGNLVRAGKLGFQQFAGRIVTHLKTALIKWITGPLGEAGVYIPTAFTLTEIVKLVLSVLGLTWTNIRSKLVKIIPDPILAGLEKTASVLTTLVRQGPAAAWEQIKGELNEMKDQLIGQVTSMISTEVVKAAVVKLVSMLNPAGAVIQAIIATYNTVMFFIERAQQIGAVVASFIDSIASIAAGNIAGAANRVEQTLVNGLTVAISFLARFVGLGGIPGKVVGIVKKIRQPIDRGLDKIVGWLGKLLDKVAKAAKQGVGTLVAKLNIRKAFSMGAKGHQLFAVVHSGKVVYEMASRREPLRAKIQAALSKKTIADDKRTADKLRGILASLARMEIRLDEAKWTSDRNEQRRVDALVDQETTQLALKLQQIGRDIEDPDLIESKWVLGGRVHPDYAQTIRKTFYGAFSGVDQRRKQLYNALHQRVTGVNKGNADWYQCPGFGRPAHDVYRHSKTGKFALDHQDSVASHWNRAGRLGTQDDRVKFLNDSESSESSNLTGLCTECNSRKGSKDASGKRETYNPLVGPGFKGPDGT